MIKLYFARGVDAEWAFSGIHNAYTLICLERRLHIFERSKNIGNVKGQVLVISWKVICIDILD